MNHLEQTEKITTIIKMQAYLNMAKPKFVFTMGLMSGVGAICSPNFMSPLFPQTFLSQLGVLGTQPEVWSIVHAIGGILVTMLVWMGTAILNDYCDEAIDRVSNQERPLQKGIVTQKETLNVTKFLFCTAVFLTWLEGDRLSLALVVLMIILGVLYSMPPFRLRKYGLLANIIIGVGIGTAFLGGAIAQFYVSLNIGISAIALAVLITAVSSIKDFKDMEGDRIDQVNTLPVVLGYERAIWVNVVMISIGYGIAVLPLILSSDWMKVWGVVIAFVINLIILLKLFQNKSLLFRRRALSMGLTCFLGVMGLYVLAQI